VVAAAERDQRDAFGRCGGSDDAPVGLLQTLNKLHDNLIVLIA
jgi:hypothetical protein